MDAELSITIISLPFFSALYVGLVILLSCQYTSPLLSGKVKGAGNHIYCGGEDVVQIFYQIISVTGFHLARAKDEIISEEVE